MIDELTVMQEPAETAIARGRALTADELFRMPDNGDRPRAGVRVTAVTGFRASTPLAPGTRSSEGSSSA